MTRYTYNIIPLSSVLAVFLLTLFSPVQAATKGYALWCFDSKTLYFVAAESAPYTYNGKQMSKVWEINDFNIRGGAAAPIWINGGHSSEVSVASDVETVIFEESFTSVQPSGLYSWFHGCSKLTRVEGLANINTSQANYANKMFYGCTSLRELNFVGFDISHITNTTMMFYGCEALETIYADGHWDAAHSSFMFRGCTSLHGAANYQADAVGGEMANDETGYFTTGQYTYAVIISSEPQLHLIRTPYPLAVGEEYKGKLIYELFEGSSFLSITNGDMPWHNWGLTNVVVDRTFRNVALKSCANWFNTSKGRIVSITGLENLNTSAVTSMSGMFEGCGNLTSLDLSQMDTHNVTDVSRLFAGCSSLTNLTLADNQFKGITQMQSMFSGCKALRTFDFSTIVTDHAVDMSYLFQDCRFESFDVSVLQTSNVECMKGMFKGCNKLTELDVNTLDIGKVTDASEMFSGCSSLTTIYCDKTWSIATSDDMFAGCTSLVGAITYDESKVSGDYANPMTGYFYSEIAGPTYDPQGRFIIRNADDWETFAQLVNGDDGNPKLNAVMMRDVNLGDKQTKVGTDDKPYEGTFDGKGHLLTIAYVSESNFTAPFAFIKNSTIENLHVTGTIQTSHRYTSGIAGCVEGESTFTKCWSSVSIQSDINGNGFHGGMIGIMENTSSVSMTNCLFDGKLLGENTTICGGFIGLATNYIKSSTLYMCLSNPASISFNVDPVTERLQYYYSGPMYAFYDSSSQQQINKIDATYSFYTNSFGSTSGQGTLHTGTPQGIVDSMGPEHWQVFDGKPALKY